MTSSLGRRLLRSAITGATTIALLLVTAGFAAASQDGTRPGWGCGDQNHVHTGPPGGGNGAASPCGNKGHEEGDHFAVSAPASVTAGTSFTFTVTVQDPSNNTDTSFAGTVHFTSTDASAGLPADSTLTNGTGTFTATLVTLGAQTITASSGSVTGTSNTITVTGIAGLTTHFAVVAPSATTAGTAFTFTVTALDAFNAVVPTYAGTIHFTSSDGNATLPANSTLGLGTGTFSATLRTAGAQTTSVTDTANAALTGTSAAITVSAAAATHFAVSAPSAATNNVSFTFTVTARDAFNNVATTYAGTIHFTSSDGAATIPANSTLSLGTGTFSATLRTPGNQTITATDTLTPAITGTSGLILVS